MARYIDARSTGLTFIFGSNCNDYIGQPVYCLTFVKRNLTKPLRPGSGDGRRR